jgi:hypothetical protein
MGARLLSDTELARARELLATGLSLGAVARMMGRSRAGLERHLCHDPYSDGRACSDCSTAITNFAKSGRCRACNTARRNKDPEMTAKRMAGKRRAMSDPIKYARACQIARDNIRRAMADPEKRAKAVERGKVKAALHFNTPEGRAWCNRPEVRARAAKSLSETRMAWCPPEYRAQYFELMRLRLCSAAEGRQFISDQIAKDRARLLLRESPFERQDRALARGAKLVANDRGPSFGEAIDYGEAKWEVGRVA